MPEPQVSEKHRFIPNTQAAQDLGHEVARQLEKETPKVSEKHRFIPNTQAARDLGREVARQLEKETPKVITEGSLYTYGLPDACKDIVNEVIKTEADNIKQWARNSRVELKNPHHHRYPLPQAYLFKGGNMWIGKNKTSLIIPLTAVDELEVEILINREIINRETKYPVKWGAEFILQLYDEAGIRLVAGNVLILYIALPTEEKEEKEKEEKEKEDMDKGTA